MADRSAIVKVSNLLGQTINPATEEKQDALIGDYALRYATKSTDATIIYVGVATIGSASSDSVWQIQEIDTTNGSIKWAAYGVFTQVFNNRESLTYV